VRNRNFFLSYRNHITSLGDDEEDWSPHIRDSLTNLLMGKNDIADLPNNALSHFHQLSWLDLEHNKLTSIAPGSLPTSLQTLSASNNLINRFPAAAIDDLRNLSWLYLRGNYLEELPEYTFQHRKRLDKLDLGENFLRSIPQNLFNGSLTVRDLSLDFNYLRTLPSQAFRGLNAGRIYLSKNRLEGMDDRAFVGLGHTLEYLDLDSNLLDKVPKALQQLKRLKYLYIASNKLSDVPADAFEGFSGTLRALSLSGNQLSRLPREALQECKRLSHLNLGYNQIFNIEADDFAGWGGSLETLLLINNRITHLDAHVFRHMTRLKELSLSFNQLTEIHDDAFVDLGNSLLNLEMSFGLNREDFPDVVLKPLTSLSWLALDNNNLRSISRTSLYTFSQLQYLNLEANKLNRIPPELFHANVHRNLVDIRLAYNLIEEIETGTFTSLPALQTVVLTGNHLRSIQTGAFSNLPALVTLELSENRLTTLAPKAFTSLPILGRLKLQFNELREFSLGSMYNITLPYSSMMLNLSHNQITGLFPSDSGSPVHTKVLDVSHNRLPEVPVNFLQSIATSLRRLYLGYNRIQRLDDSAFGTLEQLQVTLFSNSIRNMRNIIKTDYLDNINFN
jgi:Leucine-rich repeat (LRR) protein